MAEENKQENAEDEIIIIEEDQASSVDGNAQEKQEKQEESDAKKKKLMIVGGAAIALLLVVLIVVLLITILNKKEKKAPPVFNFTETTLDIEKLKKVKQSNLEKMISKANYLYSNNHKQEALILYEKIAQISQSISLYNLGVSQLSEQQYQTALDTFKKAIRNGENRCVSALNAAVCSLHLKEIESFHYYIDLAMSYLPYENDSQLYSYYFSLINYYKNNYFETLSSLKHRSSTQYQKDQDEIQGEIQSLYQDYYGAIESFENADQDKNNFTLGLLYANIGDITLAKKYLEEAITQNSSPVKEQLALAYINIKSGHMGDAGSQLQTLTDMYPEEIYSHYPIKISLKESLFDPKLAQSKYRSTLNESQSTKYQKIFYYSPYKVFNATQTISYIRKGNANIYIDNIVSAQDYLNKSSNTSSINYGIAKGIQSALSYQLREANTAFLKLYNTYPKHSILNYNLGLTYAQLGDMQNAHTYFLKSYYLDANNYLSGIYALITGRLIKKDHKKLYTILKTNLADEDDNEEFDLYRTLLHYMDNNFVGNLKWLNSDYKDRPLYLILKVLIAKETGRTKDAKLASKKLTHQLSNDLISHLIYIDTHFNDLDDVEYAKQSLLYLKKQVFSFEDLYYGPFITRYLYTQMALITGTLFPLREQLKEQLQVGDNNPQDIMSALALSSIYDKAFEESYTLYNQLIDDFKIRDASTLFYGAVASTGALHHANALALLELAKRKNTKYSESRYALALLYMEVSNNLGAAVQLSKIGNSGFISDYFNFKIDGDKLLYKKFNP